MKFWGNGNTSSAEPTRKEIMECDKRLLRGIDAQDNIYLQLAGYMPSEILVAIRKAYEAGNAHKPEPRTKYSSIDPTIVP